MCIRDSLAELEARRARLDDLILTVQRTINDIKRGTKMTDQEKFEAFKRRTVEANETAFGPVSYTHLTHRRRYSAR